jgi:hypothetical protein
VIEFAHPSNSSRRPLYNAIKYATAFPVIFLSAAQKNAPEVDKMAPGGTISVPQWHGILRLWYAYREFV